jgi:integrase
MEVVMQEKRSPTATEARPSGGRAASRAPRRPAEGIEVRHQKSCRWWASREDADCDCEPSYRAYVYRAGVGHRRKGEKVKSPAFRGKGALSAAKQWRADARHALARGTLAARSRLTLREAADAWLAGAKDGSVRTRSGDRYKPSAIRGYEQALRDRILPDLGAHRLSDISRADVQGLADRLLSAGLEPSTIRNALMPLRAIYRRAVSRGEVGANPTTGLELPAVRGRRDRIATPDEAAALIAALPEDDRALWAAALYGGLRRGELLALRWEDVDLAAGVLRVERAYDPRAGEYVEPKSRAGRRRVPIPAALRETLIEHRLRPGRADGLVFGRTADAPFDSWQVKSRADKAWKAAGLAPIGLHEARHTFASLMIAAGVNAKALSAYMGHSSVTITLDRYGHLMPGNEDEAAALLDAYLSRADTAGRISQLAAPEDGGETL